MAATLQARVPEGARPAPAGRRRRSRRARGLFRLSEPRLVSEILPCASNGKNHEAPAKSHALEEHRISLALFQVSTA
jgi:hypothetical protein